MDMDIPDKKASRSIQWLEQQAPLSTLIDC